MFVWHYCYWTFLESLKRKPSRSSPQKAEGRREREFICLTHLLVIFPSWETNTWYFQVVTSSHWEATQEATSCTELWHFICVHKWRKILVHSGLEYEIWWVCRSATLTWLWLAEWTLPREWVRSPRGRQTYLENKLLMHLGRYTDMCLEQFFWKKNRLLLVAAWKLIWRRKE